MADHGEEDRSMTPTQLEAAMRRAGVGQYENMTGTPYPYKSRQEEAEAIVAELGTDPLLARIDNAERESLAVIVAGPDPMPRVELLTALVPLSQAIADALAAAEPAKEGAEG